MTTNLDAEERPRSSTPQIWSAIASCASAITSIIMLILTILFFSAYQKNGLQVQTESMNRSSESRAVDLLLKYRENAAFPSAQGDKKARTQFDISMIIAESIYNSQGGFPPWSETVKGIVEEQGDLIQRNKLSCEAFSGGFVEFLQKTLGVRRERICE